MEYLRLLISLWPVFLGILGLLVWVVNLRRDVETLRRDHESLKASHDILNSSTFKILMEIKEKLGNIEGQLLVIHRA
jgi:hypothetical protein